MPRKQNITAEDLYLLKTVSGLQISPDGSQAVYAIGRVDKASEKKYSNLWIAPLDRAAPFQYTFGDQSDTHPRWSPDGKEIAFLSNRGDPEKPAQIYLISASGGEAHPLTAIKGAISAFAWSPDGKHILAEVNKTDPDALARQDNEKNKKLGVVSRHYQRVFYKLDGYGYLPIERTHLWLVDTRTGRSVQLTDHPVFDEKNAAWSSDGKWIVYLSNHTSDPDLNPDAVDLFVIPSTGVESRQITTPFGPKFNPSFSPDGSWIAYYGSEGDGLGYLNQSLWIVPSDSSTSAVNLTKDLDLHVESWTINDIGSPETIPPTWSNDSQRIYFPIVLHGSSHLYSIHRDGTQVQPIINKTGVLRSYSFSKQQDRIAYTFGTFADPAQICSYESDAQKNKILGSPNQELLKNRVLGDIEETWIKGPDGNDLQGWILTPPNFDPAQKYPSILEIHGGPQTQYGNLFMHEFYFLAAHGYVVHFCNPRGGRGYGEEHTKAIWRNWGNADYADLMAWTDFIEAKPYIAPDRMGVTGGSYGGYMTVWIIGHTARFKAAVAQRCVSNFISMWGSSDFNWVFQQELSDKPPFEDLQYYWDRSPIKYIGNAKTPTLVLHNEMDLRCPIEQGEQVFVALKKLEIDTEMVRFPDEFHGLSRTGRTDRRIVRLNHILRWFDKYL